MEHFEGLHGREEILVVIKYDIVLSKELIYIPYNHGKPLNQ